MRAAKLSVLLGAATCLGLPIAANAATIVSNFGPGHSYLCCIGSTISGPSSTIAFEASVANEFTAPENFEISQIDLGLGHVSGGNSAFLSLWTESGGLPGTEQGSWIVGGLPAFGSTTNQLTTIGGITGINLIAGANYFLVIDPGASDTWDAWNYNANGATGLHLLKKNGGDWVSRADDPLGAFDVLGTRIPEPSTLVMFGIALAGVGAVRRKTMM